MSTYREKQNAERIRELEAELAEWKAHGAKLDETYVSVKARAEKAEARVAELKKARCDHCGEPWYEFDEFEAREREVD